MRKLRVIGDEACSHEQRPPNRENQIIRPNSKLMSRTNYFLIFPLNSGITAFEFVSLRPAFRELQQPKFDEQIITFLWNKKNGNSNFSFVFEHILPITIKWTFQPCSGPTHTKQTRRSRLRLKLLRYRWVSSAALGKLLLRTDTLKKKS